MWQNNLEEIKQLRAQGPPPPVAMPEGLTPYQRWNRRHSVKYQGWTPERWEAALEGMAKRRTMAKSKKTEIKPMPRPELAPTSPQVEVATASGVEVLGGPASARYISMRGACSQLEWTMFVETWNRWFADFPEYAENQADQDDVESICWETVVQSRLRLLQVRTPRLYKAGDYHESCTRMKNAKESLGTRRADRENAKASKGKGGNMTINVAVAAGEYDEASMQQRRIQAQAQRETLNGFLDNTSAQPDPLISKAKSAPAPTELPKA